MRVLLGRGRCLMSLLILRRSGGDAAVASTALVGTTILLAQPSTTQILAQLPPHKEDMHGAINTIFATGRSDVSKHKALTVSRSAYVRCAHLRRSV